MEYEVGDFTCGEGYLERILETISVVSREPSAQHATQGLNILCIARITGILDHLDVASRVARTVVSSPLANPFFAMSARAGLGMQAVLRPPSIMPP